MRKHTNITTHWHLRQCMEALLTSTSNTSGTSKISAQVLRKLKQMPILPVTRSSQECRSKFNSPEAYAQGALESRKIACLANGISWRLSSESRTPHFQGVCIDVRLHFCAMSCRSSIISPWNKRPLPHALITMVRSVYAENLYL